MQSFLSFFGLVAAIIGPTLNLEVKPIHEFSLKDHPSSIVLQSSSMVIKGAYSITTNEDNKKIIGSLATSLPPEVILTVFLEPPKGALSLGKVVLSHQNSLLVSRISRVAEENLSITYTFSSPSSPLAGTYSHLVHFTLVD